MKGFISLLQEELDMVFSSFISPLEQGILHASLLATMSRAFDKATVMDSVDQMHEVASSAIPAILKFFKEHPEVSADRISLSVLSDFQARFAEKATELHYSLRKAFLSGARGVAPASDYLGLTRRVYEFVRQDLGVKMHGDENLSMFPHGINSDNGSIGQNISKIYEVGPCDVVIVWYIMFFFFSQYRPSVTESLGMSLSLYSCWIETYCYTILIFCMCCPCFVDVLYTQTKCSVDNYFQTSNCHKEIMLIKANIHFLS